MYYAAEDVNIANNLLKASLPQTNHDTILILPRSQVEALLLTKNIKINKAVSLRQKLAAKYRRRKEQKKA